MSFPRIFSRSIVSFSKQTNGGRAQVFKGTVSRNAHQKKPLWPYKPLFITETTKPLIFGGLAVLGSAGAYAVFSGRIQLFKKSSKDPSTIVQEEEEEEPELPPPVPLPFDHIQYLIVGGGTTAATAFRAIKARDVNAKILVISADSEIPYMRPPLSKELWFNTEEDPKEKLSFKQWNGKERSIFYEHQEYYTPVTELAESERGGISIVTNRRVVKLDPTKKRVILENGDELTYDKCLLATGGKPKNLPVFENASEKIKKRVTLFRDVKSFRKLHKVVENGKDVVIIGGGFLGSELACALGHRSTMGEHAGKVIQIFQEYGNMAKVLPEYISHWTTKKVMEEGAQVIPNTHVQSVAELPKGKLELTLNNGEKVVTDHVVVAVGIEANTDLAESAGLEVDEKHGGYLVNAELEARSSLWVAGDAACFYDIKLGRRRVEHHDHAIVSGRLAGENMTGAGKPYWHQSMFWSDLGPNVGYEAIGIVDSSLQTVGVFAKATEKDTPKAVVEATGEGLRSETEQTAEATPTESSDPSTSLHAPVEGEDYGKGVIFYLRKEIIVGVVLWNVFDRMAIARRILREGKQYDDLNEVAKLFSLHASLDEEDLEELAKGDEKEATPTKEEKSEESKE